MQLTLDPTNPGQFFACCGLFELADQLWNGAEAWFENAGDRFLLRPTNTGREPDPYELLRELVSCPLKNIMPDSDVKRLKELSQRGTKSLNSEEVAEKKHLESIRRDAPLTLGKPFDIQLNWWQDDLAGGAKFKTWAGQQSVIDIADAMKNPLAGGLWQDSSTDRWLSIAADSGVPFNFDSNLGPQSAALDVGFSLDPLGIKVFVRPLIEFGALIGLQRFRPAESSRNRFQYALWFEPLLPSVAAVAAAGKLSSVPLSHFEFRLLFRTTYLKSFLPAQPKKGMS